MISPLFSHLLTPFLVAMFLAVNMGGSGTAPAFSAAYGANIIRKGLIPGLFGIMVFLGAIIAGKGTATSLVQLNVGAILGIGVTIRIQKYFQKNRSQ